jgi:hypothetical protein
VRPHASIFVQACMWYCNEEITGYLDKKVDWLNKKQLKRKTMLSDAATSTSGYDNEVGQ